MRRSLSVFIAISLFLLIACNQTKTQSADQVDEKGFASDGKAENITETKDEDSLDDGREEDQSPKVAATPPSKEPKTVMDFFALLPEKYFMLEGCFRETDKDCRKARAEYIKNFKEVEDIKNGYFKGGCDGGQRCIEMAIFKRPDKSYVVALATFGEMLDENYFLDYENGVWSDISDEIIPEYSKDKRYEIPRYGTTVKVFSTKLIEKGDDYEIREKDKNIYDLEWKNGKFVKK